MVTTGSFPKQLIKGIKMVYGKTKKMNYKKKPSLKPGKISPRKRMAMKRK